MLFQSNNTGDLRMSMRVTRAIKIGTAVVCVGAMMGCASQTVEDRLSAVEAAVSSAASDAAGSQFSCTIRFQHRQCSPASCICRPEHRRSGAAGSQPVSVLLRRYERKDRPDVPEIHVQVRLILERTTVQWARGNAAGKTGGVFFLRSSLTIRFRERAAPIASKACACSTDD